MYKTVYNLHLKGYVGGADFDRNAVYNILAKNSGKQVNVLIDSLGGFLATGLSISAAFKNHGNDDAMCKMKPEDLRALMKVGGLLCKRSPRIGLCRRNSRPCCSQGVAPNARHCFA